nr:hypothetical protein BaRGS_002118 [Batillaria attramentaria]
MANVFSAMVAAKLKPAAAFSTFQFKNNGGLKPKPLSSPDTSDEDKAQSDQEAGVRSHGDNSSRNRHRPSQSADASSDAKPYWYMISSDEDDDQLQDKARGQQKAMGTSFGQENLKGQVKVMENVSGHENVKGQVKVMENVSGQENVEGQVKVMENVFGQEKVGGLDNVTEGSLDQKEAKSQVVVMEELLDQLKEQERDMDHQWSAIEKDINARYAAALGLLASARNECLSSLRIVGQEARDKLQREISTLRDSHSKLAGTSNNALTSGRQETSPLSETELEKLQKGVEKNSARGFFKYKADDISATSLEDFIQDYMGTVVLAEESGADQAPAMSWEAKAVSVEQTPRSTEGREPSDEREPLSSTSPETARDFQDLQLESSDLDTKVEYLLRKYTALEDENNSLLQHVTSVRDTNALLAMEVAMVKQGNAQLGQNVAVIQQGYGSFLGLQVEVSNLRTELSFLQAASQELRSQVTGLQWELSQIGAVAAYQKPRVPASKSEPLTAAMLAASPPQEQKQMLGERLFPVIHRTHPDVAGKVTGMLLEIDNSQLLRFLEDEESLQAKVEEAVAVLQAHEGKETSSHSSARPIRKDKN